jgi:NarL family two-component system response regulator LiaR
MKAIRVLVIDDHPMMRESMRMAVEVEPDMRVVGEAANGQQAVQLALTLRPDVIVMDLFLPVQDGIAATAEIIAHNPEARILAMTSARDDEQVKAAIQAGAVGYILKDASRVQFLQGVREVACGRTFLPPDVVTKLANSLRHSHHTSVPDLHTTELLTRRQQEVLALLGEGLSNQAIAERLTLSESTVRVHIYNILNRLDLEDRNQAIVYASHEPHSPQ